MSMDKYYSRKEVLEILKVSTTTLWHLEKRGQLMPVRVGHLLRYAEKELFRYLKVNEEDICDQVCHEEDKVSISQEFVQVPRDE